MAAAKDELKRGAWDIYSDLPIESLGRLPPRIRDVLTTQSIVTIGQLEAWLARGRRAERNYGRGSHRKLLALLQDLKTRGPNQMIFGRDQEPTTAHELYDAYVHHLKPDARIAIEGYYSEGLTLEEIAHRRTPRVTRERIRQVIATNFARDLPAWGPTARRIFARARTLLEAGAGVAPLSSCLAHIGTTQNGHLMFLGELAGEAVSVPAAGRLGVTTILPREAFLQLRREIGDALEDALGIGAPYSAIENVLREFGICLPTEDTKFLLQSLFAVHFEGDTVYSGRRKTQALYVECLRNAGRPMSAQEVANAVLSRDPDAVTSARNAVVHFARSGEVFSVGKGQWGHLSHLGVTMSDLDAMSSACLEYVPRSGAAVSVIHLLKLICNTYPLASNISPYAVRDAMIHTGKVRGWRAGCDVAWREGAAATTRVTIAEWSGLVAELIEQPFVLSELAARVADVSGTTEQSVMVQLAEFDQLLTLGQGEYVWRGWVSSNEAEIQEAQRYVLSLVPNDDVVSLQELCSIVDLGKVPKAEQEPRIIWALGRTGDGMRSRIRGHLLWRAELGGDTWSALRRGRKFEVPPVFTARTLSEWLRKAHAAENESLSYALLQEATETGRVLACGRGWYLDSLADQELLESAIDETSEFERLVRCDQDFVRNSPARARLNASRSRKGLFEVWD